MAIKFINARSSAKMTNVNQHDVTDGVVDWLRDYLGLSTSTVLTPETRVNFDLGVDGGDGAELLDAFAIKFGVDIASLPDARYFGPEAGVSPVALVRRILEIMGIRRAQALDPLFIKDLIQVVLRRRAGR